MSIMTREMNDTLTKQFVPLSFVGEVEKQLENLEERL
jgi:hypothetical protein